MEKLSIGRVVNTFGIKGELKIFTTTDFVEERFAPGAKVYVEHNNEFLEFIVKSYRHHKDMILVLFEGVNDINDVEYLKGSQCFVSMSDVKPLKDGYYFFELKNLSVVDEDKNLIGKVLQVEESNAHNNLRVELVDGRKVLIPFVDAFIVSVNLEEKEIVVSLIEGLI